MHATLQHLFNKIETQRLELINVVRQLPEEVLFKNPAAGKWSAVQILAHLYTSEKMSLAYIKKKSLGIDAVGDAGVWQSILLVVLRISQRIPVRYRAPKIVIQNTPETVSLPQLIAQWDLLRIELKAMLENLPESYMHKLVYKHPFAGRLSLPQAIEFFGEHMGHHKPQLTRILKNHP